MGEDFAVINGVTVRSGDFIRDGELGSAERPAALAEAHSTAGASLIEACAPLNLEERVEQVFDTAPIIFIEAVETRPWT